MLSFNIAVKSAQGRELIAPFSLSIHNRDKIAIIGEEGNGKSLFFKTLINDPSIQSLTLSRTLSHERMVFAMMRQDLSEQEKMMDITSYLIEDDYDRYQHFDKYLNMHLPYLTDDDLLRPLSSFSGGERVKLQIIRLMLLEADVYLLDEPTNDLDIETILWLEDWILSIEKPVLFISHDATLIRNVANRIVHFEQTHRKTRSKVSVFEGDYDTYIETRQSSIAHHNQVVDNKRAEKAKQMDRWRQLYQKVDHKLATNTRQDPAKGRLLKKKMKAVKSMGDRFEREVIEDKIDTEDAISLRFNETGKIHHKLIHTIDIETLTIGTKQLGGPYELEIYSTDKIAIIGRNGIGKSTLLEKELGHHEAFMHQDYSKNIDYEKNPIENCVVDGSREERALITNHLGSLKFTETEMNTAMKYLSGGQKAKVSLLRLVLSNPELIVLDEPTRNLSPLSVTEIYTMLNNYKGAIVCVSHDRALLDAVFNDIIEMTPTGFVEKDV